METDTNLAQKKVEFIQQIIAETSYDTLCEWLNMHEEARYAASLNSDEPDLKRFRVNYEKAISNGLFHHNAK